VEKAVPDGKPTGAPELAFLHGQVTGKSRFNFRAKQIARQYALPFL
jgi:hypothetical protein